jgi:predicted Zn-dependent protease
MGVKRASLPDASVVSLSCNGLATSQSVACDEQNLTRIRALLEKYPEDPQLLSALASELMACGKMAEAESVLKAVWRKDQSNPEIPFNLALLCLAKGSISEAEKWAAEAKKIAGPGDKRIPALERQIEAAESK